MTLAALALPLTGQTAVPAPTGDLVMGVTDQRMTVPVTIGDAGPFAFIIDTGAERTVIARELATTLGLARGRIVRVTAMTGTSNVGTVTIPSLNVSTITSPPIEAPALEAINLGAQGMLGIDTLRGHSLVIDFEANRMTLTPSAKRLRRAPARADDIVVRAKSYLGQLIVTDAHYRGQRIRVILDTGSSVTMGNAALRKRIRTQGPAQQISLRSVTGGLLLADYTQVERVEVGGVAFENLPVAFADAAPFRRFGLTDKPALLLGMDAMNLFRRVEIDFANREVRFSKPRTDSRGGS
ncbi:MAG: retroviral-like aspartic protease family protein [Pseudomonadota bacterium]|uniref:retroviral-like aspartic protease family protein n=1 Tax=Sphingomonas sp. ERG5 TaxID=1381597 RepID=UPI000690B66E|nr:retroviral-like aspartic protease family protein [Sphingomonas sp. ERG5]